MSVCQNGAPPMFLPFTNVTVTLDQSAITRGFQLAVGNPAQIVSLRPSTSDDSLYVVNRAECAPTYNSTCIGSYGGVFDSSASHTFSQVSQGQWNGSDAANPNSLSFVHFNDVLQFGNATIYGFPAMFDEPGYGGQGVLPLGWDSDFLRLAVANGDAPSTVYGLWTGSRSTSNPVDGSLVLGGYDTTRVKGDLTQFPAREKCELCVIVTGLTYDGANGPVNLFSNSSESLQINLQPSERYLTVPQNVYDNFQTATGGVLNGSLLAWPSNNVPKGNLTVTLQNGYTTTIPSDELFYYPRGYSDSGILEVLDNTYVISPIVNATANGYVMDWGIPYLTMNYIIGDYKRAQFQMAPAIRTNFANQGGGYALTASCDPTSSSVPTATGSGVAGGQGATGSATASASSSPVASSKSSNTGAIVGGVVGGVLGLILIVGGLGFLFWRSKKRSKAAAAAAAAAAAPPAMGEHGGASQYGGSTADRNSHWTAMSPTENGASELHSKTADNVHVNQWLSSQASDTQTVTSATSPNTSHTPNAAYPTTSTMDRPFEMPAQPWDTR